MKLTIPQIMNLNEDDEKVLDVAIKHYLSRIDYGAFKETVEEVSSDLEVGFDMEGGLVALYRLDGYPDIVVLMNYDCVLSGERMTSIEIIDHQLATHRFVVRNNKITDNGELVFFQAIATLLALRSTFDTLFVSNMNADKNKWAENLNKFLKELQLAEPSIIETSLKMIEETL